MPLSSLLPSRKTLATAGGFIGGMYFAQNFMKEKLEEAKEKLEEDRLAKENLKRRFSQTHHTTSYTILALLPELSSQILSEMDVEALTKELQALGRSGKATATGPRALPPSSTFPALPTSPSLASSVELIQNPEAASLASSYANVAAPGQAPVSSSLEDPASHTRSTTEESGGSGSESLVHVVAPSPVLPINEPPFPVSASVNSLATSPPRGAMSESMFSSTASLVSNVPSEVSSTNPARTKAELWNEVKILTLTRTLTTLYSITLLSLLTTLQLSTLARYKYLLSIYEQEKEERMREDMLRKFDISNMVMKSVGGVVGGLLGKGVGSVVGGVFGEGVRASLGLAGGAGGKGGEDGGGMGGMQEMLEKLLEGGMLDEAFNSSSDDEDDDEDEEGADYEDSLYAASFPQSSHRASKHPRKPKKPIRKGKISPETENKYLTLSWWLLHVGCKDVGERVRRGVEDVFEGVSLKTKLSAKDLHRLLSDVRRRVEYEVTFEGVERRVDFLSSLLPSTPETIHHVLVQGGFTPPPPPGCSSTAEAYRLNPEDPSSSRLGLPGSTRHTETDETMSSSQLSYSRQFDRRSEEEEDKVDFDGVIRMDDVRSPVAEVASRRRESFGAARPGLVVPNRRAHLKDDDHRPSPRIGSVHDLHPPEASSSKVPNNPPKLRDPSPRHLPDPYPHITNDPAFLHLVHETRQTIASVDFGIVLGACLEKSVEVLFDGLGRNVFVESSPPPVVPQQGGVNMFGEGEKEKEEVRIRLAGLLPGLARWSQLALNGMPNELVDSILSTYEIPVLSAIVFGRFEEDVGYY